MFVYSSLLDILDKSRRFKLQWRLLGKSSGSWK